MSKIAIADNCSLKFSKDIKEHFEAKGHEVRYEHGASEVLAQWADLYYVDWFDNNVHYLYKLYHGADGVSRTADWDNNKKPIIVVRAIDWEVWCGLADDPEVLKWVDKIICIAPHIKKQIEMQVSNYNDLGKKITVIRPGVNLEKFYLKEKQTDGFQIGMVLGDMWWYKNHMAGLDIFATLAQKDERWRLHIRGKHEPGRYNPIMMEHYLQSRGITNKVLLYDHFIDINDFYEKIDFLLHPGMKETFCYAVGEAMAKGITPIVNRFYGADDIWPSSILYNTHEEAVGKFQNKMDSLFLRNYIQENYDMKRMLNKFDILLET